MDPLETFHQERGDAFAAKDPMAPLSTVASVDASGVPQLRTLVLRDLDGRLALFINATSPKWESVSKACAVCTYWPSTQIQYRISATTEPVPAEIVAESWLLRPDAPKRMDWFYTQMTPQSSPIEGRDALLNSLQDLNLPDPLVAPDTARGLYLNPTSIERLDLTQANGVHDRTLYTLEAEEWRVSTLVP